MTNTRTIRISKNLHDWLKKENQRTGKSMPQITEDIFDCYKLNKNKKIRTRIIKEIKYI